MQSPPARSRVSAAPPPPPPSAGASARKPSRSPSATGGRRRRPAPAVTLCGESLGMPMYHALSGNLPVLSAQFHRPPARAGMSTPALGDGEDSATRARADFDFVTGNLPVLSVELLPAAGAGAAGSGAAADEAALQPGWVELADAVRGRPFWWNVHFRSWRATRPAPTDDGRRGARRGEQQLARAQLQALRAAVARRAEELAAAEDASDAARSPLMAAFAGAAEHGDEELVRAARTVRAYLTLISGRGGGGGADAAEVMDAGAPGALPPALSPLLFLAPADLHMRALERAAAPPAALTAAERAEMEAALAAGGDAAAAGGGSGWVELFSRAHLTPYYLERATRRTQWLPPPPAALPGMRAYARRWQLCWDAARGVEFYARSADGGASALAAERVERWLPPPPPPPRAGASADIADAPPPGFGADGYPADYDGPLLVDYWAPDADAALGFFNSCSGARSAQLPAGWPRPLPAVPPPEVPLQLAMRAAVSSASAPQPMPRGVGAAGADGLVVDREALATFLHYFADDDEDEEAARRREAEDLAADGETIIFPDFRGYLRKKGGGTTFWGRTNWKERYFCFQRGMLSYFGSQEDWERRREPVKRLRIAVKYYELSPMPEEPLRFCLFPLPPSAVRAPVASRRMPAAGRGGALDEDELDELDDDEEDEDDDDDGDDDAGGGGGAATPVRRRSFAAPSSASAASALAASSASAPVTPARLSVSSVVPSSRTLQNELATASRKRRAQGVASAFGGGGSGRSGGASEDGDEGGAGPATAHQLMLRSRRMFLLEAPTREAKASWLRALRGRRLDGLHRADSATFADELARAAVAGTRGTAGRHVHRISSLSVADSLLANPMRSGGGGGGSGRSGGGSSDGSGRSVGSSRSVGGSSGVKNPLMRVGRPAMSPPPVDAAAAAARLRSALLPSAGGSGTRR